MQSSNSHHTARRVLAALAAGVCLAAGGAQPGGSPQPGPAAPPRGHAGIRIVPRLERPAGFRAPRDRDFAGYLMVYFKDETHCAYFAISRDGSTFTDVNGGNPVLDGALLAGQKGVRDPHITRGPDGAFYLAMTDLHIYGQKAGFRSTRWERPEEEYGWGNNRAIVLMKSFDLIHWTHSIVRVDEAFPGFAGLSAAWAPQTIYDEKARKMMVYFTIRFGPKAAKLYYSYANAGFTRLETEPKALLETGGIDGDIVRAGGKFHLHFVTEAKVRHAVSSRISGGYVVEDRRIDPETVPTEAPTVFRRLDTDKFVLMYDVYGARPNNMGFSETTDFITYRNLGRFNEGVMRGTNFERPKHGAVTYLTLNELRAAIRHWKVDLPED
jgi:hypothetical protein